MDNSSNIVSAYSFNEQSNLMLKHRNDFINQMRKTERREFINERRFKSDDMSNYSKETLPSPLAIWPSQPMEQTGNEEHTLMNGELICRRRKYTCVDITAS